MQSSFKENLKIQIVHSKIESFGGRGGGKAEKEQMSGQRETQGIPILSFNQVRSLGTEPSLP